MLALVLISFIFISIQLWAQTVQVEEARSAQRFRVEAMRTSLSMVDNDALNRFSNASMVLALDTLSRAIEDHPDSGVRGLPVEGGSGTAFPDGTGAANRTMYELMAAGSTSGGLYPASGQKFFYYGNSSNLTYSPDAMRSTLPYFFNQTGAAARLMGYDLVWGNVSNFSFNQTGLWQVSVYFEVPMNLTDPNGQLSIQKTFVVNTTADISGMTDPMAARQDRAARPNLPDTERPHRNVYHVSQYLSSDDAQARLIKAAPGAVEGMGWFFGPVSTFNSSAFTSTDYRYNLSKIGSYILETSDMNEAISQSAYFGAIVLQNSGGSQFDTVRTDVASPTCSYAVQDQHPACLYCLRRYVPNTTNALDCPPKSAEINPDTIPVNPDIPYVAITGSLNTILGHENYNTGLPEILIQNALNQSDLFGSSRIYKNSYGSLARKFSGDYPPAAQSRIYDMTGPRDMAICGYYVASPYGPSFLQRLTALAPYDGHTPYSKQGYGIESFLTGRWAGGADDPVPDWTHIAQASADNPNLNSERDSRLDYQFYPSAYRCAGSFIQGMPGCKSLPMCANDEPQGSPRADATGRFAISNKSYDAGVPSPADRYNLTNLQYFDNSIPVNKCD